MLRAYRQSWKAEKLCLTLYRRSETNDESDACRHFVWSILLQQELGSDFASQVLNAHEKSPGQPETEKAMDLANDRYGLLRANELKKDGGISTTSIFDEFKDG